MKPQSMSAIEFRAELERLNLGQSAFATTADIPLRTVQSWALGERSIPRTVRALIDKVERLSRADVIIKLAESLSKKEQTILLIFVEELARQSGMIEAIRSDKRNLDDQIKEQADLISKNTVEIQRLKETIAFQATKIRVNEQELKWRVAKIVACNS